jgi:phosphatidylserine decarboxylase
MFKNYPNWTKAIHREGHIFIIIFLAVTFLFSSASSNLGWICFVSTIWCVAFFRNPDRVTPIVKDSVIAPADGVVQKISTVKPPEELKLGDIEMTRVSIFLSVFDVHVNRVPCDGKIKLLHYHPGRFFNASLDKASEHNERQSILMETDSGINVGFVQIAGLVARRIVCDLEEGMAVKAGQRFGIIRFGSRLDVYMPNDTEILVSEGQYMLGGETIIADLKAKKTKRSFEIR